MGTKLKPQNATIPWVASFEFPCHADARAFAMLVEEQFGDKAMVRKKNVVYNQGAFANWRTTNAVREALQGRTFNAEMVGEALATAGYSGTYGAANSWLVRATAEGVVQRIVRGIYEFTRTSNHAPKCAACQPEPLQCAAI